METKVRTIIPTKKLDAAIIITDLQKQAKPLFKELQKIDKVTTAAEFDFAGQQMKALKSIVGIAVERRKDIIKPMRDGLNKTIEKLDELYKPFFDAAAEIETGIKLKMSVYLEQSKNKKSKLDELYTNTNMRVSTYAQKTAELTVNSTKGGAQVRKVWEAILVDRNKVPRKYLFPDMRMVEADLKAGKKVAGFSWEQVEHIAI